MEGSQEEGDDRDAAYLASRLRAQGPLVELTVVNNHNQGEGHVRKNGKVRSTEDEGEDSDVSLDADHSDHLNSTHSLHRVSLSASESEKKERQRESPIKGSVSGPTRCAGARALLFGSWLNILLLLIPFAFLAHFNKWGDMYVFIFSFLALCPLAERVSFVTEEVAKHTNDTIGGLMNATMGNATELIVSMIALKDGMIRVVQVSLVGSVLSNLLLVLGSSFFLGGLRHSTQHFNQPLATTNSGLLMLAVTGLMFPALLDASHDNIQESSTLVLSRVSGVAMLIVYALLIVYQLKTHRYLFEDREDAEGEEPAVMGVWQGVGWAAVITALISILSQFIVTALEGAAKDLHMPILFIAGILLPIVGNAAEHAAALIFARRNKMDIALGIAIGSATQIALFVIPLTVVVGMFMKQPMTLDFHIFETAVIFVTVIMVSFSIHNGESDWLKGVMLIVAYLMVAGSFWNHRDPTFEP